VQLGTEMAVIQRRPHGAVARIGQHHRNIVTEERGSRDGPGRESARSPLDGEQAFPGGNEEPVAHLSLFKSLRGRAVEHAPRQLSAGQGLRDVDLAITRHWIAEMLSVSNLSPINEHDHVLPHRSLVVEHVGAGSRVPLKDHFEYLADGLALDIAGGTVHVALNIGREGDSRHVNKSVNGKQ
jgi:hypothetical protein